MFSNKQDPMLRSDSVPSPNISCSTKVTAAKVGKDTWCIATCAHGPHGTYWNIPKPFAWLLGKPPNSKPVPLPTAANASVDSSENDQSLGHATVACHGDQHSKAHHLLVCWFLMGNGTYSLYFATEVVGKLHSKHGECQDWNLTLRGDDFFSFHPFHLWWSMARTVEITKSATAKDKPTK